MKQKVKLTRKLTESAIMLALATILSLLKIVDLPYGGSVTLASLLPILVIAYRHGIGWGLATGLAHGAIQFVLGSSVLSYVTGWQSVVAVILLDYIVAFAVVGLGGLTRKVADQRAAILGGAVIAGVLRYICHVISGATVWAGLSIPTAEALKYSFVYNATYMIPETIVLALAGLYLFSTFDFSYERLKPFRKSELGDNYYGKMAVCGAAIFPALIFTVSSVFAKIQNAETGEFDVTGISNVDWYAVCSVTAVSAIALFAALIAPYKAKENEGNGRARVAIVLPTVIPPAAVFMFSCALSNVKVFAEDGTLISGGPDLNWLAIIAMCANAAIISIAAALALKDKKTSGK